MATLTTRERMLRTYRRQEIDRMLMIDSAWAGTVRRWYNEGMPQNVGWEDYFGFDKIVRFCPNNSPRFEQKVLEENETSKIITTSWGQTRRVFKAQDSTPETLDCYYDCREKWEEAKARMLDLSPALTVALQNIGGGLGSMIRISGVIAACATVNAVGKEGKIILMNLIPAILMAILTVIVAYIVG